MGLGSAGRGDEDHPWGIIRGENKEGHRKPNESQASGASLAG